MSDGTDIGATSPQNLFTVEHRVPTAEREARNGHRGGVLWFTGLSGAGKSTLAFSLDEALFADGYHTFVLDGDNMRRGINADLGFSPAHRSENIRRVGEVAALFAASGTICISAFISPYRAHRAQARAAAGDHFHEVYVRAAGGVSRPASGAIRNVSMSALALARLPISRALTTRTKRRVHRSSWSIRTVSVSRSLFRRCAHMSTANSACPS